MDEPRTDRVLTDVLEGGGEPPLAVDNARGEATSEEVAGPAVPAVEALGMYAAQALDAV